MRKVVAVFVLAVSALFFTQAAFAQKSTQSGSVTKEKAVNVGNKICPVTGQNIDETSKVTYEYEGKIYNFCCSGCLDEFKKNPDKYIKKVQEELKQQEKIVDAGVANTTVGH
jgi:YHS domain-containing protein